MADMRNQAVVRDRASDSITDLCKKMEAFQIRMATMAAEREKKIMAEWCADIRVNGASTGTKAAPDLLQSDIIKALLPNHTPKTSKIKIHRLSGEEIEERMKKGLCMFCEELETPNHFLKHKRVKAFVVDNEEEALSLTAAIAQTIGVSETMVATEVTSTQEEIPEADPVDHECKEMVMPVSSDDKRSIDEIDSSDGDTSITQDQAAIIQTNLSDQNLFTPKKELIQVQPSDLEPSLRFCKDSRVLCGNFSSSKNVDALFAPRDEIVQVSFVLERDEWSQEYAEHKDSQCVHQVFDQMPRGEQLLGIKRKDLFSKNWSFKFKRKTLEKRVILVKRKEMMRATLHIEQFCEQQRNKLEKVQGNWSFKSWRLKFMNWGKARELIRRKLYDSVSWERRVYKHQMFKSPGSARYIFESSSGCTIAKYHQGLYHFRNWYLLLLRDSVAVELKKNWSCAKYGFRTTSELELKQVCKNYRRISCITILWERLLPKNWMFKFKPDYERHCDGLPFGISQFQDLVAII